MDAEGVAGEEALDPAAADERGERRCAAGVDDDGSSDDDNVQSLGAHVTHEGSGLADRSLHLALGRDAVGHEGKGEAVALFGFGDDADAAHADDNLVTGLDVAQAAAIRDSVLDNEQGVHTLVAGFVPRVAVADKGPVIGRGVEIFGGAAVAFDSLEGGIAGVSGRAAEAEELREHSFEMLLVGGLDAHAELGGFAVGAADVELFDLEPSAEFDDGVEDLFHDVRVDQVAFCFDDLLQRDTGGLAHVGTLFRISGRGKWVRREGLGPG